MSQESVRWGVIGASRIADDFVIPAIKTSAVSEIAAIGTNSVPARAQEIADRHSVPQVYDSVAKLLDDPKIDAVYIGSTSDAHAAQAIAAAAAGKHVFVDKPLALTADDANAVVEACAVAGVQLGVNQQFRGAATHRAIQAAVRGGDIGEVRGVRTSFTVQLPPHAVGWRTDGPAAGVAMDLTIHTADTLRAILGQNVAAVSAFGANHGLCVEPNFDVLFGTLLFEDGTLATFHDAFTIGHSLSAVEVFGSTGSIVGTDVMRMSPGGSVALIRDGNATDIPVDHHDLYEPAVAAFVGAVLGDGVPAATGADGVAALRVAEAAVHAAATRTVVDIKS
ncbi:1,5-anhydro-D-fructose reductase (1,5-anhydro-D-mannitol-forming) [Rhodococcus sp. 27YEA15]|uniref:Gfo/Idh/MocA family protein n=1 Tax=Rhodococcus sp. 27YEA15 TaxID=3156259 RepID=UPI003C7AA4A1